MPTQPVLSPNGRTYTTVTTLNDLDAPRVLVVDDNTANLAAFEAILDDPGFELVLAQSGAEAMRQLLSGTFAAILLDINMPTLDGLETAGLIRRRERTRDIPILFITAHQPDATQLLRAYASGAVDYLVKPVAPEILRYKVRTFVELFRKSRQVEWQATQLRAINARLQQEIGQRREAERDAAFEREERQRVALSSIADAVISLDAKARVSSLNRTAEALTGWSSASAQNEPLEEVLAISADAGQRPLEAAVREAMAQDCTVRSSEPLPVVREVGMQRYIDYSVVPVHDRRGKVVGAVLTAQDVTDRHRADQERARALLREQAARKAAEEASRARDEFLAVISHELRTPLNAIVGWTQILRTEAATAAQRRQAVDAIQRSATAQKQLIEDLLDMSRIINGRIALAPARIDLHPVVQAAVETVQPAAQGKGIAIECELDDEPLPIEGDRQRLEQVFWNLLVNAVKFTPEGGRVEVAVRRDGPQARIAVRDSGEGIDLSFLPHLFEAFRQADSTTTRRQGGLGLGLAIAHTLVSLHGGSITAHSDGLGQGARFEVELPLAEPAPDLPCIDADAARAARLDPRDEPLARLRVLVVDDDDNTREMLSIVMQAHGAQVRTAGSVAEALRVMQEWPPELLLSDISMPGEDGYSLIRRVRDMHGGNERALPAVAITAMASAEDREEALRAGFQAHVTKPLQFGALLDLIATLVPAAEAGTRSRG
jgi:PAS domain S-box-containing protein